jgi:uncharacterized protein YoxC
MSKNIDEAVDKLEETVNPDTVVSVGGYSFTPAKLMIAGTIVTTVLGGLYGVFEVYKDYTDMKEAIQEYVTPDLSEINKKIAVIEENSSKSVEYTRDIKNDLKQDIRRLEGVVEQVERNAKQSQREAEQAVREVRGEIRQLDKQVDDKIKKALDNPLAQ